MVATDRTAFLVGIFLVFSGLQEVFPCSYGPDISCPEDVANTFLALHQSVAKDSGNGRWGSTKITGEMDLVLLIDEGALKSHQHYWTKQFIKILSEIFVIAPKYTRVSVVAYGSSARVIIPMSSQADVCSFMPNITSMSFSGGASNLLNGVNTAISELKAGRSASSKLTILLTNADWGNLGAKPDNAIAKLKAVSNLAAIIFKHPGQKLGLLKFVLFDYFVSYFGSKKLGFTVELTPEYMREFQNITRYNKAMGQDWPLDLEVDQAKCKARGRTCIGKDVCVCELRTILNDYICVKKDTDPPEAVKCDGPASPITVNSADQSAASVTWAQPLFSDTSGIVSMRSDMLPGLYHPGTYRVTNTATDENLNTATCSFSFTVQK